MVDIPTGELAARLVLEQGPEPDKTFKLGNAPQTIGRSANNGIVINDAEISRRHAQLTPQGISYMLEDLGSTNGTFVNGLRLNQPTALNHGDTIEFGDTVRLRFWAAGMPSEIVYTVADDVATPALPPEPVPVYAQPADLSESSAPGPPVFEEFDMPETAVSSNRNRILIGCGCLLVVACVLCVGTVFFLDSFQDGHLLYCGGLRPFWETVLGPVGFNPICP
ncbi:MAG: FHA domain-containing protein [Anaerolineales bacterium]|nr:FHA domain-containing protein [Anaerolineales bacterium]MCB8939140.1 FHA domain-containing protein [Ardenticatenaceae bacterium]